MIARIQSEIRVFYYDRVTQMSNRINSKYKIAIIVI